MFLRLHCYRLKTDGDDFVDEKVYMSEDFIKMMWLRTRFLGDVLRRGYNFIFTVSYKYHLNFNFHYVI
ncbi:putative nucleotide-diphospho-sugar transferase [Helianthus debilis subsp. tardiflorus]